MNELSSFRIKKMQSIFYGVLLLILTASFQNEAYKGGSGDGFAEAELIRFHTNILENTAINPAVEIYPNPVLQGAQVYLKYANTAEFYLIDTQGRRFKLGENIPAFNTKTFSKGAYILQMKQAGLLRAYKILIL